MVTLRVFSSLALAPMLDTIAPGFQATQKVIIVATMMPTALLMPRIRQGEAADVAILTEEGLASLVDEGIVDADSQRPLALSRVGVAVRSGTARPPLRNEAELVEALLAATSIGLSRAGASGLFFDTLLKRLGLKHPGLAERVYAKAVFIDSGYTAALAAAGTVELAVQQVSELSMVPGVDVGPLPPGLDGESVFSGGVLRAAAQPELGATLLREIAGAHALLEQSGLAPVPRLG